MLALTPVASLRVSRHMIPAYDRYPNTSLQHKPLLIYHGCLPPHATSDSVEEHLRAVSVADPSWRYTMYPMSHFHSSTHEVLCVVSGAARCCFGGEANAHRVEPLLQRGDVVIVPAGLAHRLVREEQGRGERFEMVGAYPKGRVWDMCYGRRGEEDKVRAIPSLGWFATDPLYGRDGPATQV